MHESTDDVAADWWEHARLAKGTRDERKALDDGHPPRVNAAYQFVADKIEVGTPDVLDLIASLIDSAPDDQGTLAVGAGPLEDLIHAHGDRLVLEIETRARRSPEFARALSSVWVEAGDLDPETRDRLAPWVSRKPL